MPTPTLTVQLALSYREIVLADSPLAYWPLAELTGTNAVNLGSIGSADGTHNGSPTLNATGAILAGDGAVTYDGTNDYTDIGASVSPASIIDVTIALSVEYWIKKSAAPASEQVIASYWQNDAAPGGWKLVITSAGTTNFVLRQTLGVRLTITSVSTVTNNAWHHVVITWDGTTDANGAKCYIDNVLDAQATATGTNAGGVATSVLIGAQWDSAGSTPEEYLAGTIDELALYQSVLSSARVAAHYNAGTAWTDVSADVRQRPELAIKYGMRGGQPTDRVAQSGEARFLLDNSTGNSGGLAGYYSPNHASVRTGFTQGITCRISFAYSGTTYYKFVGRINDIKPLGGAFGEQYTVCRALDYIDELARANLEGMTTQTNQAYNAAITSLLASMPTQPTAQSLTAGIDSFPYTFIGGDKALVNGLQEIQRLAMSEWGYVYIKGNTTTGGVLTGESRHTRPTNLTSLTTLSGTMSDIDVPSSVADVINVAQATIHPRQVSAAGVVLYSSLAVPLLAAGESITLTGPYRDPAQKASRVAGTTMIAPVATTDYTGNTASDGSGSDMTANMTVTATFGGTGVSLVVKNTHASTSLYVTKLQCRGTGLYDYDAPIMVSRKTASETQRGTQTLAFDMAYQDDPVSGLGAAAQVTNMWSDPFGYAKHVGFPCDTAAQLTAALAREIGDRVTITETQTGVNSDFFVNGVELTFDAVLLSCRWILAPTGNGASGYWSLGTAGATEIGQTTRIWDF